jgi:molybdate transport system ATP-binding protein
MLEVAVFHRAGEFTLDAQFVSDGRLTVLFGHSGSGKTSLVDAIAGLIRPERGRVAVDGQVLFDDALGVWLPPHRRRVGYVFQEGRLFPHLSVKQNLLYGRWFAPREARHGSFAHVVALLGLEHFLERRPGRLSGGEKQRVALGRALLSGPRLLLMDEPLASLDTARKDEILPYIERLRDDSEIPIVYVTHALPEVVRLGSTMVLMAGGRVEAAGPVSDVMARLDLAPLIGRDEAGAVLETKVAAHDERFGLTRLAAAAGDLWVPRLDAAPGTPVRARVRASEVMIAARAPDDLSALNVLAGTVVEIGFVGDATAEIRLDCGGDALLARLTRRSVERLGLRPGSRVYAVIKAVAIDRRGLGLAGPDVAVGDAGETPR